MNDPTMMQEHTLRIERVVEAPRELVWRAFTDPDEVTKWWGPEGFRTPRERIEFDLQPGGACSLTMIGPDGQEHVNVGRFGIVEPPARYSFDGVIEDNPMMRSAETTIQLEALDERRTKLTVTSRMVCSEQMLPMANAGWNSQLDKLDALFDATA